MSRLQTAVVCILALATFAAFFVAQRLKHAPTFVQTYRLYPVFSPNHDGRLDDEHITFRITHTDRVTVDVINGRGDAVARLLSDHKLIAYHQLPTLRWNGITSAGRLAPDGQYHVRVVLDTQDRSYVIPRGFRLDTVPPAPKVIGVGAKKATPGPDIEAYGAVNARISVVAPGGHRVVTVYRTDVTPFQIVDTIPIPARAPARTSVPWNGMTTSGQPAPPGVYLAGIQARDTAGNRGFGPPVDGAGLPLVRYGHHVGGHGGIIIRDVAVQGPLTPVSAGGPAQFFVDSRRRPYSWSLRSRGQSRVVSSGRAGAGGREVPLTVHAPGGATGIAVLTVHADRTTVQTPFAVQAASVSGTAAAPKGVLVVLPAITWQGLNAIDDDGDGIPDTLDRGVAASLSRPLAGNGLPVGFEHIEAPTLSYLDAHRHHYDLTTDLALATGPPAALAGYRGVLIAGDERWITPALAAELKAFVHGGGTLALMGTDSLLREVQLTKARNLAKPTARAAADLFGARIGPVVTRPLMLTDLRDDPRLNLFAGTGGLFGGYRRYEPTLSFGSQLELRSDAVDQNGRPVIVAAGYGKGLVIRFGLPDFASSLTTTPSTAQIMANTWTLLSR